MDITHDQLQNLFVLFMGCLFVFVLIREVMCWYWKINKGILLQEKILNELVKLNVKADNGGTHFFIDKNGDEL